jgi:outer membrane protein assembly factor BamB
MNTSELKAPPFFRVHSCSFVAFCFLAASVPAFSANWPQFLGPDRNGASPEKIRTSWEQAEPRTVWKKKIGAGFTGPIVVSNIVVLFHRIGNSEILSACDLATGSEKWQSKAPTAYRDDFGFDEGPRSTPCFDAGRVYAVGAEGLLRCVDFASGKELWTVPTRAQFKMRKGFFGFAPSPLIAGQNLLINLGGENGAGIIALDKNTGKLRWKQTTHEAGYSSPALIPSAAGQGSAPERVAFFTREGLVVLSALDGSGLLEFPWRARMHASVNAASPLIVGNLIFITTSYDTGAALLRLHPGRFEKIWSNDTSLSAHYATPVYHNGYLYGFHGRQEQSPSFRCIELANGAGAWNEDQFGAGTVTLAGDHLLILRESGELLLADASPLKFTIRGRAHVLGGDTRAYPALSNGRFVARDKSSLICLSLE